ARREDPHIQLSPGPCHRPPHQADRAQHRRDPQRRGRRADRGAAGGGEGPAAGGAGGAGVSGVPVVELETVSQALARARDAMTAAVCEAPRLDAELLLARALGIDRTALMTHPNRMLDAESMRRFDALVARRAA